MHTLQYRRLPPELYEHCVILLEEKMYADAETLTTLQSLISPSNPIPALPPPPFISLLATCARLSDITDSTKCGFVDAFLFRRAHDSSLQGSLPSHGNRYKRRKGSGVIDLTHSSSSAASSGATSPNSTESEGQTRLNNALASRGSIFHAAEGFWHVVGWAFNCSIHHPQRWLYYRKWLNFMIEILQSELDTGGQIHPPPANLGHLYLREVNASTAAGLRTILRAILADGSETSLSEFHEIWPNETKPPKENNPKKLRWSRNQVNLDEGKFGDYWDDDLEDDLEGDVTIKIEGGEGAARTSGRTQRRRGKYHVNMDLDHGLERTAEDEKQTKAMPNSSNSIEDFGGIDSVVLRRRLLGWLAAFLRRHPATASRTGMYDFLNLTAEFLRPLPSPVFTSLIATTPTITGEQPDMDEITLSRLHMAVLNILLLNDKIPVYSDTFPTQKQLQTFYLSLTTKTSYLDDLAKTAITIESLARLLSRNGMLSDAAELTDAINRSIAIRTEKRDAYIRKHGGQAQNHDDTMVLLDSANARLQLLPAIVGSTSARTVI
ncbi:MAG: hypothetical protein Q9162_003907 [Coniocarpon cinnabarinum]